MANFKHKQKPKIPASGVDGFISSTPELGTDIRRRFRQNYSPSRNDVDLESIKESVEDLDETTDQPIDLTEASVFSGHEKRETFDLDLENQDQPKKKRLSLFRSKKSEDKKGKRKGSFRKVAKAISILFIVLLLGVGSVLGYGYYKSRQIFRGNGEGAAGLQKDVDPSRLNGEGDGRVNVLLLGKGGPGHEAPDLTDTILLVSIDPVQNEAALLSIPRDLYVKDESGYSMKINAIYSTAKQNRLAKSNKSKSDTQAAEDAGLSAIKEKVSDVIGVPVHYYVMVDFSAFEKAIDTVGGISIDVKSAVSEQMLLKGRPYYLNVKPGVQQFDSLKAFAYVRCRHCDNRSDFGRTERQREVIVALQQKVLSLGTFANPFKIVDLLSALGDNVRTDLNGPSDLKRLYEIGQNISNDHFLSVGLADPPNVLVSTGMIDGQSVVQPIAGVYEYDDIQAYVRNTLKDPFLRKENSRIAILNGTSVAGLATNREKELKSYGYNIVQIDNAPTSDYLKTELIDISGGKNPYTASYLEKRLGVKKSEKVIEGLPTNETVDFVIILGSNETTTTTGQ